MKKQLLTCCILALTSFQLNAQWVHISNGLSGGGAYCIDVGGQVFAGTNNGIYQKAGNQWFSVFSTATPVFSMAHNSSYIFAGSNGAGGSAAYWSNDNGISWWPGGTGLGTAVVNSLAMRNDTMIAGTSSGVYKSVFNGLSWPPWSAINNGLPISDISSVAIQGGYFFAGTNGAGAYISSNSGASWSVINTGLSGSESVRKFLFNGNAIFIATSTGVYLSSNNGTSWTPLTSSLSNQNFFSLAISGSAIFAGTDSSGVFLSTDNGNTWNPVNNGFLTPLGVAWALAISGNGVYIWAGMAPNGVYEAQVSQLTGILQPSFHSSQLTVLSNPASLQLTVQNDSPSPIRFQLFNSLGEMILKKNLDGQISTIDILHFKSALYFYNAFSGNTLVGSGKIIIQ